MCGAEGLLVSRSPCSEPHRSLPVRSHPGDPFSRSGPRRAPHAQPAAEGGGSEGAAPARGQKPHAATVGRAWERRAGLGRAAPPVVSEVRGMEEGSYSSERRRAVQVSRKGRGKGGTVGPGAAACPGLRSGERAEPPLPLVRAPPPASAPQDPAPSPSEVFPSPLAVSAAFVPAPCSRVTARRPVPQAARLPLIPAGRREGGVQGTQPTVARGSVGPRLLPAPVASGRRALGGLALPRLPAAFGEGIGCGASPRGGPRLAFPQPREASPGHRPSVHPQGWMSLGLRWRPVSAGAAAAAGLRSASAGTCPCLLPAQEPGGTPALAGDSSQTARPSALLE